MFCTKSGHNIENTYLLERIKGVRELRPIHRRGFAPGSFCMCQYTRGSVFKFAQFAQGACSQIFNLLNIVEHILRGGNSHEDEVYPWNRWYTRGSFALGACPWSMLREQNPACVSAFILTGSHHAQALPVPLVPVHLNSSASVNLRRNSLSIYLWV